MKDLEVIISIVCIIVALCSTCASGICPVRENDTTVVLPYKRIGSSGPNDTTIETAIQNFLKRNKNLPQQITTAPKPKEDASPNSSPLHIRAGEIVGILVVGIIIVLLAVLIPVIVIMALRKHKCITFKR